MPQTAPYGSWPSPIDAALAASHDGRPDNVATVGDEVWWTEPRPDEGGRRVLVRLRPDGREESVLPAPWNVRTRVIEYGGRPWAGTVRPDGSLLVVFAHFPDQRLYAYEPDGDAPPRPLTPAPAEDGRQTGTLRWADPQLRLADGEVWCVLEEFTGESPTDVRRVVAAVPLDGSAADDRAAVRELSDDRHRFVTGPRVSPDGRHVAWIAWDHPRMPWDGTELLLADVTRSGTFERVRAVAGSPTQSVAQADWAADGSLLYVSDPGDWWQLDRLRLDASGPAGVSPPTRLSPAVDEEFGGPMWTIGLQWFRPMADGTVAVVHGKGATALGILDPETGQLADTAGPWTEWAATLAVRGTRVIGVGASPRGAYEIVELDTATGRARVIGSAHHDPVDPVYYPEPQIRVFTGPDDREIHAHIYPPHSPSHSAPADELPPYVVWAHGGPTSRSPSYSTWRSPTSPRAASASPRSTTAAPPATDAPTANGCASNGELSTSRTARPSPAPSPTRAPPTPRASPSGAAAPAAGPAPPRSPAPTSTRASPSAIPSSTCRPGPPTARTTSNRGIWSRWSARSPTCQAATANAPRSTTSTRSPRRSCCSRGWTT